MSDGPIDRDFWKKLNRDMAESQKKAKEEELRRKLESGEIGWSEFEEMVDIPKGLVEGIPDSQNPLDLPEGVYIKSLTHFTPWGPMTYENPSVKDLDPPIGTAEIVSLHFPKED